MANKILQTRVVHALKPTSAWANITTIPLKGEECLELCDNGRIKMKIGDGVHKFSELSYYIDTDIDIVVGSSTFHSDTLHNAFVLKEGSTNGTINIGVGGSTADVTVHGLTTASFMPVTTAINSSSSNSELPTAKSVWDAIDSLPEPMVFRGTVGDGGTVEWSDFPPADVREGDTYKVITDHSTTPVCEVGDTLIYNGAEWVVVPSGDEPSGTVTSVGLSNESGENDFVITGSPITSSGTLTIKHANNVTAGTAGTTSSQTPSAGTTFAIPYVTYDKHGHVTAASTASVKIPDAVSANDADLVIAVNGSTAGKFTGNQASASTVNLTGIITTSNISENVGNIITTATTSGTPGSENVTGNISLHKVSKTGSYSDLLDKPTIGNGDLVIAVNGSTVGKFTANQTTASTVNMTGIATTADINDVDLVIAVNGSSVGKFTGNQSSASTVNISAATTSNDGAMTKEMVTKLAGISESADNVEWASSQVSGTNIGVITINGTPTTVYAPTANDGKLTINAGGSSAQAFTANQSSNVSLSLLGEKGIGVSTTASGEVLIGHNTTGAESVTSASKTFVNGLTIDSFGHITAVTTGTVNDEDTKVSYVNTNNSTVSIFVGGSTSGTASTTSAWRDTNVYLSGTASTYGILSTATTANQQYKTQSLRILEGAAIPIENVVYKESDTLLILDGNFY